METQTLTIDGAMYTRVVMAFVSGKDDMRAFKKKNVCKIGGMSDAIHFANEIRMAGREPQIVPLAWYWHPSLREQILGEAFLPDMARIIVVRVF